MTKSRHEAPPSGRGEATRARILAATIAAVGERGWDAATTRDIAARAQANQGLIHYHFGSRATLLQAAFEFAMEDMFGGPMEALLAAPSLAQGAAELVRALGAMDASGPAARFSLEAMSRAGRDPAMRDMTARMLAQFRVLVADRIRAEQRSGQLDRRLDPTGTAAALAALFDGLGLHLMVDPAIDTERAANAVQRLLDPHPRSAAGPASERNQRP